MRFTFFRDWFPEQTKSIGSILLWLLILVADVVLVFWLTGKLGLDLLNFNYNMRSAMIMLYVGAALCLFWVETVIYNKITALFR